MRVEPLHPEFGVRLHGVDLAGIAKMDDATWAVVQDAFDEHGVVVIPGQLNLKPKALSEFARRLHRADPVEIGLPEECGPQVRSPGGAAGRERGRCHAPPPL